MVMESSDHHHKVMMRCSTIALLQERFRQLERVKEMREERALQKSLPECEQYKYGGIRGGSANKYYIDDEPAAASRMFFRSEIIHPTTSRKPPPNSQQLVHLSLWPNSSEIHHRHRHRHRHHHRTNYCSNYFEGSNVTTKMPTTKYSWLMKDAPLTGSSCSIKVDDDHHNMITSSTATATHDVDTSLHL